MGSWMESWMQYDAVPFSASDKSGVGPAGSAWVLGRGTVQDARQWHAVAMSMFAAENKANTVVFFSHL